LTCAIKRIATGLAISNVINDKKIKNMITKALNYKPEGK